MSDKDLVAAIGKTFISRKDVKASQSSDGQWFAKKEPMTLQDFYDHLDGKSALGHYMLGTDSTTKLFAFDLDLKKEDEKNTGLINFHGEMVNARELFRKGEGEIVRLFRRDLMLIAEYLSRQINKIANMPTAIAYSGGKGLHVYGFCGSVNAEVARAMAIKILQNSPFDAFKGDTFWSHCDKEAYPEIIIEVFPKQNSLNGGKEFGNLMGLPLGRNQTTGHRKMFLSAKSAPEDWTEMNPMNVLSGDLPWE